MNDSGIMQLFQERNEDALMEVSEKYKGYCFSIAFNILGSKEDAEECVNDALMKAWELIPPQKPKSVKAFLGTVTRNIAIDRYRQTFSEKRGSGETEMAFDELAEVISDSTDVESEAERRELLNEINVFLGKQSENKRNIFMCRYWYYDSIKQIAARFGMPENTVSSILNRTRNKLKEYLKKRGY